MQLAEHQEITEQEKIVLSVAQNPRYRPTPESRIKWELAIKDTPELSETLKYAKGKDCKKAQNILVGLTRRGITPQNFTTKTTHEARNGNGNTEPKAHKNERMVLAQKIVDRFSNADGAVDYVKALAEMPELQAFLQAGRNPKMKIYALVNDFKAWMARQNKKSEKKKTPPALSEAAPDLPNPDEFQQLAHARMEKEIKKRVDEILGQLVNECHFCPRCGRDIGAQLQMEVVKLRIHS